MYGCQRFFNISILFAFIIVPYNRNNVVQVNNCMRLSNMADIKILSKLGKGQC